MMRHADTKERILPYTKIRKEAKFRSKSILRHLYDSYFPVKGHPNHTQVLLDECEKPQYIKIKWNEHEKGYIKERHYKNQYTAGICKK